MVYDPLAHVSERFLRGGRSGVVASRSERDVLRLVWRNPGVLRSDLTKPLELTQQALHRIVESLRQRGLIEFTDAPPAQSGARFGPRSPGLAPARGWCLTAGISVHVGSIQITLMDFGGLLDSRRIPEAGPTLDADLDRIAETLVDMLAQRGVVSADLLGAGLGITGYAIGGGRWNAPLPLDRWSLVELAPLVGARLGLPVWADNSANTAALAEAIFGVGREHPDFAYVSHNYGYGGALIHAGRLYRGSFGNAGELSGIYDSAESTRRPALHLLLERLRVHRPDLTLAEMIAGVTPDWQGVTDWIDDVTPAHNLAMNALTAIADPAMIVLGGELPYALAQMLIERTTFHSRPRRGIPRQTPRLVVAAVTDGPSAIGAALLPLFETVL